MNPEFVLLLVDDEANILKALKRLLVTLDCRILTAPSGEEGLEVLERNDVQIVITDFRMPGMDGVEFLSKVKDKYPDTVRIVISGYADAGTMMEAINKGQVYKFIPKPWDDQNLLTTIKDSMERYSLQKENTELYAELSRKYEQLQELAKSLEDKVAERTRDLEVKNQALTVAHSILSYLPVGVIGVDPLGMLVFQNNIASSYKEMNNIQLGTLIRESLADDIASALETCINENKQTFIVTNKDENGGLICTPLAGGSGAIGLFTYSQSGKYSINAVCS